MCRAVVGVLKRLKEQRDMTLNEVRLTVAIEDPRARERRLMGMEVRGRVGAGRAGAGRAEARARGRPAAAEGGCRAAAMPRCTHAPRAAASCRLHRASAHRWPALHARTPGWVIAAKLTIFRS